MLGSAGTAALRRLTALAIRRAAEGPAEELLADTLAFAGAFTAVFFTGLRAALAGLGLAFAAGFAADLAAGFAAGFAADLAAGFAAALAAGFLAAGLAVVVFLGAGVFAMVLALSVPQDAAIHVNVGAP